MVEWYSIFQYFNLKRMEKPGPLFSDIYEICKCSVPSEEVQRGGHESQQGHIPDFSFMYPFAEKLYNFGMKFGPSLYQQTEELLRSRLPMLVMVVRCTAQTPVFNLDTKQMSSKRCHQCKA